MKKQYGTALHRLTLQTLWRRRGSSLLLAAVAMAGVFAALVLHRLTVRQEQALEQMVADTEIRCIITNSQGNRSEDLRMPSGFVDMLTGKRHEAGCYLDQYVKNVNAMYTQSLSMPTGFAMRGILSLASDPGLSALEGAQVAFYPGYDESAFWEAQPVCLVPAEEAVHYPDGVVTIRQAISDTENRSMKLTIIGTVASGPGKILYVPFYLTWEDGTYEMAVVECCSFAIGDNARLEECKEQIYSIFQKPDLSAPLDSLRFGVLIQDETYLRSLGEIQSNLSMLRILLPILIVLVGSTGFLAGYLTTRGRLREFAVMRCLGMKRRSIFAQIFCEQALLGMLGGLTGRAAGAALEHNVEPAALAKAAIMVGVFLSGTALATARITRVNVMKLMKAED